MASDGLSRALELVEVHGVLTGGNGARGGWWSRGELHDPVKFFAVVSGHALLDTDGLDRPLSLGPGDVAILTGRTWVAFEGGEDPRREVRPESDFSSPRFTQLDRSADDIVLGGWIDTNDAGRALLLGSLPPVVHVRASTADSERVRASLLRLFEEATAGRAGSEFAVRQYGQLFLLELFRSYLDPAALPPGWLRLLADERMRPALDLIHTEPGRPWTLSDLARAAAMSRTAFAERFRDVAGMPPMAYLGRWRMLLAQRALRADGARVGDLAATLGYGSQGAFSTAFKRIVGESPLHYRRRVRAQARTDGTA